MKVLFNKKLLSHNIDSPYEGSYRIESFLEGAHETEANGEQYLSLVHTPEYINYIRESCQSGSNIAEVKLSEDTYQAACISVGLAVKASQTCDFAIVRPPGHHAGIDNTSGFCLFNNIAIAVQKLVNEGKRVLLIDMDGHHGDGTQSIFYNSDKVLYCSIHQMNSFPFTGLIFEIGSESGVGHNLNIPLAAGSGDDKYLEALDKCIEAGKKFKPHVVAVSAGFDGFEGDRLLDLNYSLTAFYETGSRLRKSFKRVFAVLEGGYHGHVKECVDQFVEGVNHAAQPPKITWDDDMAIG